MKIVFGKGAFQGPVSGADEILTANATQIRRAGHDVSVLLLYPHAPSDQYYLRLRDAGVQVYSVASSSVQNSLGFSKKLARRFLQLFPPAQDVIRRRAQKIDTGIALRYYEQCRAYFSQSGADLVHVITPDPAGMVIVRAAHDVGIPVIYQEVGMPYHPVGYENYYEQFTSVLPFCAEVAALSPQLARECRAKLLAKSVSVLPILIDDEFNRTAVVKPYHDDDQPVTFGFAARLEHLKGPLVLMDAFAKTRQRFTNVKLHIAGSGSLERKVFASAKKQRLSELCEFKGVYTRIKEKSRFMRGLDIFILPSLTEGTPNGVIEAMAHGLPVIATTVGGLPDLISDEIGILVPPGDVEALAEAMYRLALDAALRQRMGSAARQRYEELFDPALVLPLILDTYRRVAAANGNHSTPAAPNGNGLSHPWAHVSL